MLAVTEKAVTDNAVSDDAVTKQVATAKHSKKRYVDNGWPVLSDGDDHAVSELATDRTGALSPFGDVTFPLPAAELPFIQSATIINK